MTRRGSTLALGLILVLNLYFSLLTVRAPAQQATTPGTYIAVCAYNTSPPTISPGNFVLVQCNSSGQLTAH